jgi:RND superfamily putative drug exporter
LNSDAHAALALVTVAGDFPTAAHEYPAIRAELRSDVLSIVCTGYLAFTSDLDRVLEHDLIRAEAISLPICILLLLFVFRSVVAALIPVGVGALAVASGIAVVVMLSHHVEIAEYTINMCSLIGLGVAIDYSLFIVSRYREELGAGLDYPDALRATMRSAGRMVVFSGFAVMTGLAGLLLFPRSYLLSMGLGGAIVVGFGVLFALTFLPALLATLGHRIEWGRLPGTRSANGGRWWRTMAEWSMRRPLVVLAPALAVLLAAGIPFLRIEMAEPDVRVLPTDVEARTGYELMKKLFPERAADRVTVVVEFPSAPALTAERIDALHDFATRAKALPSVTGVLGIVDPSTPSEVWKQLLLDPKFEEQTAGAKRACVGERAVVFDITTPEPPESPKAQELVRALRRHRSVGDGTLIVGGDAANNVDSEAFLKAKAPKLVLLVVVVTYVVLLVLLGSVLLPLKAVLMNFLSITASFGALVWVFQEGHLFVHEPRPIDPSLPVLLFCSLFGLSMDYEVLMLSRMKEAYEESGNDRAAVADGLQRSAGLITSAAAIMISVFGAFALSRVVVIQAVGFGMALAVAIDATIVRVLVVPTTMRLLGRLNWWAPRGLAEWLRTSRLGSGH